MVVLHHAVPPGQTVNAAYYCTFLEYHIRPALWRKRRILVVKYPIILHDNARIHTAALILSRISCAAGNGRFWNIHRTHPIRIHGITISSLTRWSSGYHTRHWIRGSRVHTRAGSMDFFQSVKILSMTSFGREVNPLILCRKFTPRKGTSRRN